MTHDTYSEDYRHQCEVRWVLRLRVREGVRRAREYLEGVGKQRGVAAAQRLRQDCRAQWEAGNRGKHPDWR